MLDPAYILLLQPRALLAVVPVRIGSARDERQEDGHFFRGHSRTPFEDGGRDAGVFEGGVEARLGFGRDRDGGMLHVRHCLRGEEEDEDEAVDSSQT